MDHRGFGKVTLEAIFEFVSAAPNPPSADKVAQLYVDFDDDGSGDIDSGEFVGLCGALESLMNMTAVEMIQHFEKKQYERLFALVDEDGGGTIDSQELKTLIDALNTMLNLHHSIADVAIMLRDFKSGELYFEDFYKLMKKITGGKSILQVVRAFEEARRQSKEKTTQNIELFESKSSASFGPPPPRQMSMRNRSQTHACLNCAQKNVQIAELQKRIQELERSNEEARKATAEPVKSIELQLPDALHRLESAIGVFKSFPVCLSTSIHSNRTSRLLRFAQLSLELNPSEVGQMMAEAADSCHRAQREVPPVFEAVRFHAHKVLEVKQEIIKLMQMGKTISRSEVPELLIRAQMARRDCQLTCDNLAFASDVAVEGRVAFCESALASQPFSGTPKKLLQAVIAAETVTQQILDLRGLLGYYGSVESLELEILLNQATENNSDVAPLEEEVLEAWKTHIEWEESLLAKDKFTDFVKSMKETAYAIQATSTTLTTNTRRDRGSMTTGPDTILELRKIAPQKKGGPPPELDKAHGLLSRPPRARDLFAEKDRRPQVVDSMIERYIKNGVLVPENFGRVFSQDMRLNNRHMFQFGTRVIDLVVVDEFVAVMVGGGFMYFDEFCSLYTEQENTRLQRRISRSRSPEPASGSPSRSGSVQTNHHSTFVRATTGKFAQRAPTSNIKHGFNMNATLRPNESFGGTIANLFATRRSPSPK